MVAAQLPLLRCGLRAQVSTSLRSRSCGSLAQRSPAFAAGQAVGRAARREPRPPRCPLRGKAKRPVRLRSGQASDAALHIRRRLESSPSGERPAPAREPGFALKGDTPNSAGSFGVLAFRREPGWRTAIELRPEGRTRKTRRGEVTAASLRGRAASYLCSSVFICGCTLLRVARSAGRQSGPFGFAQGRLVTPHSISAGVWSPRLQARGRHPHGNRASP